MIFKSMPINLGDSKVLAALSQKIDGPMKVSDGFAFEKEAQVNRKIFLAQIGILPSRLVSEFGIKNQEVRIRN